MRKVIEFEDGMYHALVQLGRDRMATLQELADEAFAGLLNKHGVPTDLKDALRKSARVAGGAKQPREQSRARTSKTNKKRSPGRRSR